MNTHDTITNDITTHNTASSGVDVVIGVGLAVLLALVGVITALSLSGRFAVDL